MPSDGGALGLAGAQAHPDADQHARSAGLATHRHGLPQRILVLLPGVRGSTSDRARHRHVQLPWYCVHQRSGGQVTPGDDGHVVFNR